VIPRFSGVFDGGGRVISGLTITGTGHLGLFGQLRPGADVRRLRLVDVNIVGSDDFLGGLVGAKEGGTVTQCSSAGTVYGQGDCVGGLVGSNRGPVTQCSSAGTASGKNCVGGLVGYTHEGTIQDCYSTASSGGQDDVGGLVGYRLAGRIMKCYAAGHVVGHRNVAGLLGMSVGGTYGDPVLDCFWDAETSGQERVVPWSGTGKATAEMQRAKTFLNACWDFVGESKNGTEDVWWIDEGKDYPRLWWEATGK